MSGYICGFESNGFLEIYINKFVIERFFQPNRLLLLLLLCENYQDRIRNIVDSKIPLVPKFHRVTRKWGKNRITSDNVISKVKILLEAGNGAIPKNFAFAILRDNNGEIRGGKKARLSTSDRASRRPRWKPRYHHPPPPLQNGRSLRLPEAQARNNSKLQIARDTRSALSRT